MGQISFNTTSRIIDVMNSNRCTQTGVDLYKVHDAACDYSHFSKLLVKLFHIATGINYFARQDATKKAFATNLMVKLQLMRRKDKEITVVLPNYTISFKQINASELECRVNGKIEGILKCNLADMKKRCIRPRITQAVISKPQPSQS